MDMRNGDIYDTPEAARAAGVPADQLEEVEVIGDEVVRITSGPFKGRLYRRTASGLQRMRIVTEDGALGGKFSRRYITKTDGQGIERLVKVGE